MLHHILEFIFQQTIKQVLNLLCMPCRFPHHLECNILFYFLSVSGGGGGVEKVTLYKNEFRVNCLKGY